MYESPIEMIMTDIQIQIVKQQENDIYQAVQRYGIVIDKEELIKALQYDREQYMKGYKDALDKIKKYLVDKLREKQQKCLDLYDERRNGKDYRSSLLIEEIINIVEEIY